MRTIEITMLFGQAVTSPCFFRHFQRIIFQYFEYSFKKSLKWKYSQGEISTMDTFMNLVSLEDSGMRRKEIDFL